MTTLRRRTFWLLAVIGAGLASSIFLPAQVPVPAAGRQPDAAVAPGSPPMPPIPKSPVESFRELLAMPAAGREKFLAARPPELRQRLQAKIREYEAMNPDKREAALSATQLYWYLEQFIQTPATNLEARLAAVPEPYRKIVTERVHQFYVLPPPLQAEVLEHRTTASYFLGQNSDVPIPTPAPVSSAPFPPLPQPLAELSRLPLAQRRDVYADFQHFFELTGTDRQKVLQTLPEAQQQQVAKLLQILERLPAPQRAQGLQSISKLAGMTDEQQQQFFRNAARWQGISPEERQSWLRLVNQLPPLPPGAIMPPIPPLLPVGARGRPAPAMATNNNGP